MPLPRFDELPPWLADPRFGDPSEYMMEPPDQYGVGFPSIDPGEPVIPPPLSFPPREPERQGFGSRFMQTFADAPTNYQVGPGSSPLEAFLASAMNSGTKVYAARKARELAGQPSQADRTALIRANEKNVQATSDVARSRVEAAKAMSAAAGKRVAKPLKVDFNAPQPGESMADWRKRTLQWKREDADATRAPEKTDKPEGADDYGNKLATRTIEAVNEAIPMVNVWTAGFFGKPLSMVAGTAAANLRAKLDNVASNIAFNELKEMRQASKTGGALGQISDRENVLLASAEGALQQAQSPEALVRELRKIEASIRRWEAAKKQHGFKPSSESPSPGKSASPDEVEKARKFLRGLNGFR